jgi:uncharacterized protein YceK
MTGCGNLDMPKMNKVFFLLLLPAILAGCSSIVTNLAPSQYPRDPSGFYRVEAQWNSNEEAIKPESFKPVVLVDYSAYPMRPVPLVEDRWEAFIRVPADRDYVLYRYKFNFQESAIPRPRTNSVTSSIFEMRIEPKK